ncbi:MAG TPA: aldo/keto reductase [Thermomicrobiales bacterium]|jgi:myo-inositol catabolism protein IolS|nr:aldo/keto reductase [Thermomicrobiales bacterium]
METRALGRSGVTVSVLGLGTWPMGGEWWGGTDDAESIRTIHRALDLGVTLFDTAEAYAAGHAEEVLGWGLAGRREQAVIADKVAPNHFAPDQIEEAFEASCRRLQTDYIDVYFLHWPNIDLPISQAMETLERLRAGGRIRAIGVSNFTANEMRAATEYGQIDVLQPPYNMFWRFIEGDQLPYCREHGIGIMAYSGLAQGLLTGNLSAETTFPVGDKRPTTVLFQPGAYGRCLAAVDALRPIAKRAGLTVPQLAIAWLLGRPGVSTALVGARTVPEIEENVAGATWQVSAEDMAAADAATREIFESLPRVPDMFQNWENWELQRRRYERDGQFPAAASA